jgi:hypothetical protein
MYLTGINLIYIHLAATYLEYPSTKTNLLALPFSLLSIITLIGLSKNPFLIK